MLVKSGNAQSQHSHESIRNGQSIFFGGVCVIGMRLRLGCSFGSHMHLKITCTEHVQTV